MCCRFIAPTRKFFLCFKCSSKLSYHALKSISFKIKLFVASLAMVTIFTWSSAKYWSIHLLNKRTETSSRFRDIRIYSKYRKRNEKNGLKFQKPNQSTHYHAQMISIYVWGLCNVHFYTTAREPVTKTTRVQFYRNWQCWMEQKENSTASWRDLSQNTTSMVTVA